MLQIRDRPSQKFKTLPRIWDRPMHSRQKQAPDSGHIYARGAETCLRLKAYLCMGCRNVPQIQGISMYGVQKRASDSGHIYARCAETCLRFRAYLCTVCRNSPQIQGILMHGVHNLLPVLRLILQDNGRTGTVLPFFFL